MDLVALVQELGMSEFPCTLMFKESLYSDLTLGSAII